ncbi:co-chaperone protein daf-41-like [Histomonas meleagridis]|uniref:co-chaperone protein daf-41-like n=1 Tax=Histomonas meleagridis TaxID=135588 RepID=UPI0035593ACB|nr:co-chaperone protein daf-41-like [Histomonas meleagridis]KAH0799752.1 co-chaperone protein daf-41-like [Histomonas meleagridis]
MQAPIIWAQRKDVVLVTVKVIDAVEPSVQIEGNSFIFKGKSYGKDIEYNTKIELFAEIEKAESKYIVRPSGIEIVLKKKDQTVWWPRLAKTTVKLHYVSVDWNRWVDSSDDDDAENNFNFDPADMEGFDEDDDDDDDDDDEQPEGDAPAEEAKPDAE